MDIAGMSIAMKQAQVQQQASLSLLKSAMTTAEQDGAALIKMLHGSNISQAPHPNLGIRIDIIG